MLSQWDKTAISIIPPILAWINQKWGLKIDASPETITIVVGFISSILVYFVPNKAAS